jgi:F-type H+-transporting ATPase subunit b
VTFLELFTTAQAYASAAAEAEHHAPSINDIWFPVANFLIYAFILIKFVVPSVRDFFKSRRAGIVATIQQASARKQAAEALVNDFRAKLSDIEKEIQSIQHWFREEGERESGKLIAGARARAIKIKEDAAFLAAQEVKMARQKQRADMADRAEATARQLIERNLTGADQNRLVGDFVQGIGPSR